MSTACLYRAAYQVEEACSAAAVCGDEIIAAAVMKNTSTLLAISAGEKPWPRELEIEEISYTAIK